MFELKAVTKIGDETIEDMQAWCDQNGHKAIRYKHYRRQPNMVTREFNWVLDDEGLMPEFSRHILLQSFEEKYEFPDDA